MLEQERDKLTRDLGRLRKSTASESSVRPEALSLRACTHTQKRTHTRAGGKGAHKRETRTRVRTLTGRSEVAWLWRVLADGRSGLRGFHRGGGGVRMHTSPRDL
jgi:hypothetical protein